MTTPDLMSLWATCILPGCRLPVAGELEVCDTCRGAFGDFLPEAGRCTLTVRDIEERDAAVRAVHFARYALRTTAELHDTDTTARTRSVRVVSATDPTRVLPHLDEDITERRGQRCWMCEQRRTCVREPGGLECRSCPTDPLTDTHSQEGELPSCRDESRGPRMTPNIDYDFAGPAPQIGLFGLNPREMRVTAPFTPAHRAALIEVGNASCGSNADGGDWISESVALEDGLLVWDAGVDRLTFTAVRGSDGMYVQVLTGPTATCLIARADWPISLELPHETARTLWQLIGIFTI